jgi:hypothetical protein
LLCELCGVYVDVCVVCSITLPPCLVNLFPIMLEPPCTHVAHFPLLNKNHIKIKLDKEHEFYISKILTMYLQWHFKLQACMCPDLSTQPPMVKDSLGDLSIIEHDCTSPGPCIIYQIMKLAN